jgi:hypothetical protein
MTAVMNLVPNSAVTDTAVQNGAWSSPSTWQSGHLPADNANVLVPAGLAVTVDTAETARLHTIRVDGTLQFATNANTSLLVDTIVVMSGGTFNIGTAASPIAAASMATVTFTDSGAIDTNWDPLLFSRGLISMGTVSMYGQSVTSFEPLTGRGAHAADTVLNLGQAPTNWQVGDSLILPGTTRTDAAPIQDENLTIRAISGTQVTLSAPLAYDHLAPARGLTVHVANTRRNVMLQSENPSDIPGRGHVMFMTPTVTIGYACFDGLGRTNKLLPVTDPQLDSSGHLIPGTGDNARGRYSVHFHHTGADITTTPASVVGSVVEDSPGWGWVNHDSYVNFQDDISYDVVGSGFVTESGDEVGSFIHNIAIRDTGLGGNPDQRANLQDFGVDGDGFWFQGSGVTVQNNVAAGQTGFGFIYYAKGLVDLATGVVTQFASANLPDPSIVHGQQYIDVADVPIVADQGNVTYNSSQGLGLENHANRLAPSSGGTLRNYTAWNIQNYGATFLYDNHTTLQNSWLLGNADHPGISALGVRSGIEAMDDLNFVSDRVEYWAIGIRLATLGRQTITGGFYNSIHSIEVRLANHDNGTQINISGNVQFGTLTHSQYSGTQYNIYMNGDMDGLTDSVKKLPLFFTQQTTLLSLAQYNGQQLYFNEQAPGYVPFPAGTMPSWFPSQLIGLTNQQLWNQYGLALGGALAPSGATTVTGLYGLLGSATTYPAAIQMISASQTTNLIGYQLIYLDQSGHRVVDPTLINLNPGWNLITLVINGVTHTFFVYGGSF